MSKAVVLVILNPEGADAASYREAIENAPALRERIELRFATGEAVRDAVRDAEVVTCGHIPPEYVAVAARLRWISYWSAGMDGKVTPELQRWLRSWNPGRDGEETEELRAHDLLLTNASGVHGPNIAEHVLTFMLMFSRQMPFFLRGQIAKEWRRPQAGRNTGVGELAGQTLGIVGLGRIGEALAARAKAFEMRVIAVKRDPTRRYEAAIVPDALYGLEALPRLLAESDHVCIALPYTPKTHHLFDATMLSHLKPSAYLYNIARGKIIEEAALIEALQAGRLAGAGLDVFETEPLPADSPLWQMENVLITPHISGVTPHYFARTAALFAANLKRYLDGQPLHNLYDPARGY